MLLNSSLSDSKRHHSRLKKKKLTMTNEIPFSVSCVLIFFVSAQECRGSLYRRTWFLALARLFRNDYGFCIAYEYTYQDREYIIRTMNTEQVQLRFSCSWLYTRLHSDALRTFVIKLLRQC